ncbi:MAG TPA: DUF5916 domain-containing protein, partial [Gemmatimonadales bacterium]|nr:DUF5916 domain-containing protein [Gemmatimonadales bacterium]
EIAAPLGRRDEEVPSDWIGVLIDSYHDRRTAFEFTVNPAGVRRDVFLYDDIEQDPSWEAVWDVATARDSAGWTAEFRIPFSQLRFSPAAAQRFGFNIWRRINRRNEVQYWRPIPSSAGGRVSLFGDLVGLEGIRPPRQVEILPYVVGSTSTRRSDDGNPFLSGTTFGRSLGADVKLGVTPSLTLSAAINPDFGQVEADPAEVNLTALETFRAEKRPFFTEGADVFQFSIANRFSPEKLFYARRIGRAPQGEADDRGGFAEVPDRTTILGAAKLTGKTPAGLTIGVLGALTAEEEARVVDRDGARHRETVEPRTGYLAGRLARDLRGGQTVLGLFGTVVRRRLTGSTDFLRSGAYVLGSDLTHRFRGDTYGLRLWAAASLVRGSPAAILEAQESPVRYYQRPDHGSAAVDSSRTGLAGGAAMLQIGKHGGGAYLWSAQILTRTPGFEANDLGFQQWAGQTTDEVWVGRRWLRPGRLFRSADVRIGQYGQWTYGGQWVQGAAYVASTWTLRNYWTGGLRIWHRTGGVEPTALEGGPGLLLPGNIFGRFDLDSDVRRRLRLGVTAAGWDYYDGRTRGLELATRLVWRPSGAQDLSVGPSITWLTEDPIFLDAAAIRGRTEHFVADLDQTTAALTFRGNLNFSPRLSLQLYAEPFLSTGRYGRVARVTAPRAPRFADRFDRLGPDRVAERGGELLVDLDRDGAPDAGLGDARFRVRSFHSSAVFRWEYQPASTLFVVWQHGRRTDSAEDLATSDHTV